MTNFAPGLGHLGLDSRHMKPGEAVLAINCDLFKELGALHAIKTNKILETVTFEGTTVIIHTIHKFRGKFLVHAGENLYYEDMAVPVRSFSGENPMVAVNYEDNVYLVNGVEFLKMSIDIHGDISFTTPFIEKPDPANITLFADVAGQLPSGTYNYLYTFVNAFNSALPDAVRDESPPDSDPGSPTVSVTFSHTGGRIAHSNLPTRTGFNLIIYRWHVESGSFEFGKVTEITDGSTTYIDNIHTSQLGRLLVTQDYVTPPIPLDIIKFNNNLMLLGIQSWNDRPLTEIDNYIWWSDDMRLAGYDPRFLDISGETDDKVMAGSVLNNIFQIFTKARVEVLSGTQAREYREATQQARTGLAARFAKTGTIVYGELILGSDRALHMYNGFQFDENTTLSKMDNLFAEDSKHPHRINWDYRDQCRMGFLNRVARLAYPSVNSTVNDKVLKMDFRDYPNIVFTVDDYETTTMFSDGVNNQMIGGNSLGEVFEMEKGITYRAATWKGGDDDKGDIHAATTFQKVRVDIDSKGKDVAAKLTVDDVEVNTTNLNKNSRKGILESYASFGAKKGKRAAVQFDINQPDHDVAIYDFEIDIGKPNKS